MAQAGTRRGEGGEIEDLKQQQGGLAVLEGFGAVLGGGRRTAAGGARKRNGGSGSGGFGGGRMTSAEKVAQAVPYRDVFPGGRAGKRLPTVPHAARMAAGKR